MAMGDYSAPNRTDGIDVEIARLAIKARRRWEKDVLRSHAAYIGRAKTDFQVLTAGLTRVSI